MLGLGGRFINFRLFHQAQWINCALEKMFHAHENYKKIALEIIIPPHPWKLSKKLPCNLESGTKILPMNKTENQKLRVRTVKYPKKVPLVAVGAILKLVM